MFNKFDTEGKEMMMMVRQSVEQVASVGSERSVGVSTLASTSASADGF